MSNEHENRESHENHERHDHSDAVDFFVNDHRYETIDHTLTGLQIKDKAHIPPADELFLETASGDESVPNDKTVHIRKHDRFHSMPSPQYGAMSEAATTEIAEVLAIHRGVVSAQPDGWHHLVFEEFAVPVAFTPRTTNLLVKLPPGYPLAAPDMFWVKPGISLASNGGQPQATSVESFAGDQWQRFSWHLPAGYWQPGKTTLRDFLRAVSARLQKAN